MAQTWLGARDLQIAQQVREHLVPRVGLGGPGMPVQRFDPHPPHQGGHVLPADDARPGAAADPGASGSRRRDAPGAARPAGASGPGWPPATGWGV